jgi:hypothetical protein
MADEAKSLWKIKVENIKLKLSVDNWSHNVTKHHEISNSRFRFGSAMLVWVKFNVLQNMIVSNEFRNLEKLMWFKMDMKFLMAAWLPLSNAGKTATSSHIVVKYCWVRLKSGSIHGISERWKQFQLDIFPELYVAFEFYKLHLIILTWKFIDVQCAPPPSYNILFQIYFTEFKCNI